MMKPCQNNRLTHPIHRHISRRRFLTGAGAAAAGMVLAGCQPEKSPAAVQSTGGKNPIVAMAKADNYDRKLVRKQVQSMLDAIGGLGDVLAHGNRVGIKINMTGGVSVKPLPKTTEIDTFVTHPEVVRALIELLRDAGAKDIYLLEAAYEPQSWVQYGFTEVANDTGAIIVDLTDAAPYKDFVEVQSSNNPFYYDKFKFNPILTELDAFISVSKMKCHNVAGVTHSMKNSFGLVPYRFYTMNSGDRYRSEFHGQGNEVGKRVPGVIMDLNHARPVNLALIDGILTAEGGEGPWIQWFGPVKPGVMFAGKDPVATDAVATAAMGFDPTANFPDEPFVNGRNHLNMAAELGMGTNRLEDIKVVGGKIDDVKMKFKVSY
jgi:uncharacterized protein (DUF362 family)